MFSLLSPTFTVQFMVMNWISHFRKTFESINMSYMESVDKLLALHFSDPAFGVKEMCTKISMSQPQLYRKVKRESGYSTVKYIQIYRLSRGYDMLVQTSLNVTEVAYMVGFNDPAYFSRIFSEKFGRAPGKIRKSLNRE